jgi:hypothetical protein
LVNLIVIEEDNTILKFLYIILSKGHGHSIVYGKTVVAATLLEDIGIDKPRAALQLGRNGGDMRHKRDQELSDERAVNHKVGEETRGRIVRLAFTRLFVKVKKAYQEAFPVSCAFSRKRIVMVHASRLTVSPSGDGW